MDIVCDGLIIKEKEIGESDKIITLITEQYGKISVYSKGVKSIKNKNSHAISLFCYSSFELVYSKDRYILKTAVLKEAFYGLRDSVEKFALASYIAEVLSCVCTENSNESDILKLALNMYYACAKFIEIPCDIIKGVFELKCMIFSGFMPDTECCAMCETYINEQNMQKFTDKNGLLTFNLVDGAFVCNNCMTSDFAKDNLIKVSYDTYRAVNYIVFSSQKKMLSFSLPGEYVPEFSELCEKYLLAQTERNFDTLDFYKSIKQEL